MSSMRVIICSTLIAVSPVLFVTLQTLLAAWRQEGNPQATKMWLVGDQIKIDEIKAQLAGGPEAIRARKEIAAALPVAEFFRSGFTAIPLNASATAGGNDKAWEELSSSLTKLNNSREAFEIAEKHIGRRALGALSNDQLTSFAKELRPAADAVPTLKDWPNRLEEMSKEVAATKVMRSKLVSISRDLDDRIKIGSTTLSRISDADLRKWSQQLAELKNHKADSASIETFPIIVEQHQELKRRVDFWSCWNPPTPIENPKLTSAMLESRRTALIQLEKTAKASSDGEAKLPEETDHTEKVSKEIDHLAGEVLYLNFKERQFSKKSEQKSMAELLREMLPIIEIGAHQNELLKDFKSSVEQRLAAKKTRDPKFPVYDFVLPGGEIWLAHSDKKAGPHGELWIWSYDLETDKKIGEHRYLSPQGGFLKISEPEELRIVDEFNKSRNELLGTLDQSDSWKEMQSKIAAQEMQLNNYYRKVKQFWEKPGTGKHRLAPNLDFTADQKLISEVLEHWSIVKSLHQR